MSFRWRELANFEQEGLALTGTKSEKKAVCRGVQKKREGFSTVGKEKVGFFSWGEKERFCFREPFGDKEERGS